MTPKPLWRLNKYTLESKNNAFCYSGGSQLWMLIIWYYVTLSEAAQKGSVAFLLYLFCLDHSAIERLRRAIRIKLYVHSEIKAHSVANFNLNTALSHYTIEGF